MIKLSQTYSGILLAGGKSSRMGEDKAFMRYNNKYLFEYSYSILELFSDDILVSSSNPRFTEKNYRIITDEFKGIGPLGGIYSCLKHIKNNSAIILPCDLPLITEKIITVLINNSEGSDISIALNDENLPEPLVGIYSSSILPLISKMIISGNYKLQDLLKLSGTNFIKVPDLPAGTFSNINYREEFDCLPPPKHPDQ